MAEHLTADHATADHATADHETAGGGVPGLPIPELSLVVLIGASGSGKSTFAARHFRPTQVVSSDACRGMVADDANDQAASPDAFELLHFLTAKRLARGLLTVVDATNVQPHGRADLVALARAADVLPVAIVLDLGVEECLLRNRDRADRDFGDHVVRRQHSQLRRSLRGLGREGFRTVHVLSSVAEVDAATVRTERLRSDRRDHAGPFDLIGDVHGCRAELEQLLDELSYTLVRDERGRPVDAVGAPGRTAVFLGDLVDRGPDSAGVLRLVMGMVEAGHALCLPGNHEAKLVRALSGRKVAVSHGLAETLEQLAAEPPEFGARVRAFCDGLVAHLVLDGGRLVVAHAGLKESYHGRASGRVRSFALYGDTTGETDEFGLPVRYPWAQDYRGRATVVYGHTPAPTAEWVNNTICVDTGCVFGGRLSALRYPERELVSVPAARTYYEPARPLGSATAGQGEDRQPDPGQRPAGQLDLTDVTGRRTVETTDGGRVTVPAERAAAALEVMSRFALPPAQLWYLPPTMSPVDTSTRDGLLEHPDLAFDYFRDEGVDRVVCQEKHMGSRAVVQLRRDGGGTLHTRTGRAFFSAADTRALLARWSQAATDAGLFAELDTDWLLLDAELLPWSAKATELVKDTYAGVGAAGRAGLSAATAVLDRAAGRGLDVGDLADRTTARLRNVEAFTAVYRRFAPPVHSLAEIRLAPFQVLAAATASFETSDHGWHLALVDRLVAAAPEQILSTRRLVVDLGDPASTAAAVDWWQELTVGGAEGMVVKPYANLTRGRHGLVQPGLKVRGREYLRIIYGPDYTEPAHLARLRARNLRHKRSLALREYALGLEAVRRAVADEPLWRVHECVFAVLALESEPVDPRL